jgi:hypothetical protein
VNNITETAGVDVEIIPIDNSDNKYSIFSAYNTGYKKANFEYLCFLHEDISFKTHNWGQKLIQHLSKGGTGFVGIAGGNRVDVKASKRNKQSKRSKALRWSFLFSKQSYECDFFCCFCLTEDGEAVEKILLIPHEIAQGLQTMSVPCASRGKWGDFEISSGELADFFASI